ncbi:MAG: TetR/AcrR family transcriptional regulator [Lachnospira sp.]|nr:TetR/AcrR family transcriptional regulator [Lachnospira sp.]MDD5827652.1 TetR/AcrR family transcriptional regulator [Lachnospira sp.]
MRRTKEEAEETKKKIIEACYEVILEKGYDKMTRDDIAVKLGMTRGAVNWHFKDKEEMYLVTLEYILDKLKEKREIYINNTSLTVMEKMKGLFEAPLEDSEAFHFINQIPHYLLLKDNFKSIEQRKNANRIWFIDYMKSCLSEYENENKCVLTNSKQTMAEMLYLLYEGLHNRNTNKEYETIDFHSELDKYFKLIIK